MQGVKVIALLFVALPLLFATGGVGAEPEEILFGVVAVQADEWVKVSHVLPDTPAAAVGLRRGNILYQLGDKRIEKVKDIEEALKGLSPGDGVQVLYITPKKKKRKKKVRLIARGKYDGDFLRGRDTAQTGFEAPEWHAYAWGNLEKGQKPPTRQNTRGKVVVIHAFQSW